MDTEQDTKTRTDFIHYWLSKTKHDMEGRCLPSRAQHFSRDISEIERFVEEHLHENVYYGVCSRRDGKGDEAHVVEVPCLWSDIDFKDYAGGETEAVARLAAFQYAPTIVIHTGNGLHAYWFFKEAEEPTERIERILEGISQALQSDLAVCDIPRVLRMPDTFNYKYEPARPVKIIQWTGNEYLLSDFADYVFKEEKPTPAHIEDNKENRVDVPAYLKHYGVAYKDKRQETAIFYCLEKCLFEENHTVNKGEENQSAIVQQDNGLLSYQCFHSSCKAAHRTWADARQKISGKDSLKLFLSNYQFIGVGQKDNKNYQGFTEGGIQDPLDRDKPSFDPISVLKKGSDLMTLDIHVEWIVDNLVPKQSITLLHGRGGIGKTWISLVLAHAVSKGTPFMGLGTVQCPVIYIDYENSLPVLVERVKKIQASDVLYWHNTNEMRPPKIDTKEWELYKSLPVGLLIYDTLRASQSKDENDSRQMAEVMTRLKELRDAGFTILLLHHTPKGNDQTYKGSTAILDLADHILSLHKVRKGSLEETDDDETENVFYRFGTKGKTRYEPFHIFLEFQKEVGFVVAPDPDTEEMEEIYDLLSNEKELLKQSEVYDLVKAKLSITSKGKVIRLLNKGIGTYWETKRTVGRGRSIFYCPIVQPLYRTKRTETSDNNAQAVDSSSLSFCPLNNNNNKTERTETIIDDVFVLEGEELPEVEGVTLCD